MAIIGIDLGTTYSLACVYKAGKSVLIPNSFGEFLTPSVVSVDGDGSVLVGKAAKERLISHPDTAQASFKRFMGQKKTLKLGKKTFTPEELSSFVLRKLKEDAEAFLSEPVTEAIISVPAYFSDSSRAATKNAGHLAGIHVERLVNEPSAAALAYRLQNREEDESFLIFDFGGGTLDVSVVDCFDDVVEISAIAGNNHLGGDDFDMVIARAFCDENGVAFDSLEQSKQAIILKLAMQCKHVLSEQNQSVMVFNDPGFSRSLILTNEKLFQLSAVMFDSMSSVIRSALKDSRKKPDDFTRIVLVGGSSKMPVVRRFVSHIMNRDIADTRSPDTVTGIGAGVYAGIKERQGDIRDVLLTDICPFTLGTNVVNYADPKRALMCPIIERNCTLPVSKVQRLYTVAANQKQLKTDVYQGEAVHCDENFLLGSLSTFVPPAPESAEYVDLRFTYDINGILDVEVTDKRGKTQQKTIVSANNTMSAAEIEKKRKELLKLKIHPRDLEENRLLVARAERIFVETTGDIRAITLSKLEYFQRMLESQPKQSIMKKIQDDMRQFLDSVDGAFSDYEV